MLLNILWIAPSKMCLPIDWTYFSLCTNTATSCKLHKICFSKTCRSGHHYRLYNISVWQVILVCLAWHSDTFADKLAFRWLNVASSSSVPSVNLTSVLRDADFKHLPNVKIEIFSVLVQDPDKNANYTLIP